MVTSKCEYIPSGTSSCAQLIDKGLLPAGAVSFAPATPVGNFTVPSGCGSSPISISYDEDDGVLQFGAAKLPVLAAIAREEAATRVFFFGKEGVAQVIVVAMHAAFVAQHQTAGEKKQKR